MPSFLAAQASVPGVYLAQGLARESLPYCRVRTLQCKRPCVLRRHGFGQALAAGVGIKISTSEEQKAPGLPEEWVEKPIPSGQSETSARLLHRTQRAKKRRASGLWLKPRPAFRCQGSGHTGLADRRPWERELNVRFRRGGGAV